MKKQLKINIQNSGVYISCDYPLISPWLDGIGEDLVIEMKCPNSGKLHFHWYLISCNGIWLKLYQEDVRTLEIFATAILIFIRVRIFSYYSV